MRRKLFGTAIGLAALALRPRAAAEEPATLEEVEKRLASLERVLLERTRAEATPAAGALYDRLERFESRLRRLEGRISMMRR